MSDIVDRLRNPSNTDEDWRWDAPLRNEAANKIERLTAENERHLKSVKRLADREIDLCDRLDAEVKAANARERAAFEAGWNMRFDNALQKRVAEDMEEAWQHYRSPTFGEQVKNDIDAILTDFGEA